MRHEVRIGWEVQNMRPVVSGSVPRLRSVCEREVEPPTMRTTEPNLHPLLSVRFFLLALLGTLILTILTPQQQQHTHYCK